MSIQKKISAVLIIILCVSLLITAFYVQAEDEIVEQYKDTKLDFLAIYDPYENSTKWEPKGRYEENLATANYKIHSNAYATWFEKDNFHFAYKKLKFSYGAAGTLVAETTLNSWNAVSSTNAAAGIMIRNSLNPNASNVFLQVRPDYLMVTYRLADGGTTVKGKTVNLKIQFPISLKIELKANKAKCYIKQKTDSKYSIYSTVPFMNGNDVYAGLSAYSQAQEETALADFTGYNAFVTVPEGTDITASGSTSTPTESEDTITLPEDPEVEPNVLLRESFTDGTLTHEKEQFPNQTDWYFDEYNEPEIVTTDDYTNRYVNFDSTVDGVYLYGGDQHWSDYTTEMEVTFTNEWSDTGKNEVHLLVRATDIWQYGVHGYSVSFKKSSAGTVITLGRRNGGTHKDSPTDITQKGDEGDILSAPLDYLPGIYDEPRTFKVKVVAFDNVITVYLNGELTPVLRYTDVTENVNGFGAIAVIANSTAARLDSIVVTEETDLAGGSYDNEISGLWNEATPEIVDYYANKKYQGFTSVYSDSK